MVTYHPDSPSRMYDHSLDEAARTCLFLIYDFLAPRACTTCLSSIHTHAYTHRLHFGPRVAHWPEATHVCIVRAPVPPSHTHVPAPPHTLTSPTHPLSLCLMYSASTLSFFKLQAWGIRQGLCSLLAPHTECVSLTR
jgi:hypothetical protein